jgi:hypothetical protein
MSKKTISEDDMEAEEEEMEDDEDGEKSDDEDIHNTGSGNGARETVTKWVVCSGKNNDDVVQKISSGNGARETVTKWVVWSVQNNNKKNDVQKNKQRQWCARDRHQMGGQFRLEQ